MVTPAGAARPKVWRGARRATLHAALLGALLLAGCAAPKPPTPAPGDARLWSGRLALVVDTEPPQNFSAAFELSGNARQGQLRLYNPLGSTLAELQWAPGSARLTQGGQTRSAASADALLAELMGTAIPTAALFDWLDNRPTEFAGWRADRSRLAQGRLQVQREQPLPTVDLRIKLDPAE